MRIVKVNGEVVDTVRETLLTVAEIQEAVGGHFAILHNRIKINDIWHLVIVWEDAFLNPQQNMVASKMVGRLLYGDVLFLLDGVEIN